MKKFRHITVGIIIGVLLSTSSFVFADTIKQYIGTQVTFPVYVNGEEYKPNRPFLAIEGTTYVPLVEVGQIVGSNVEWNNDAKRVDVSTVEATVTNNQTKEEEVTSKLTTGLRNYINFDELTAILGNDPSNIIELGVEDVQKSELYLIFKGEKIVFNSNFYTFKNNGNVTYIELSIVSKLFDESIISQLTIYQE